MNLTELITKRDAWLKAEDAVMKGQNYSIEGMAVTRVDADKIQARITQYNRLIKMHQRQAASGSTTGKAVWK